jgi:hypothetical protein
MSRGGDDPGERVVGDAVARPALEGRGERFLCRFFGKVEVAGVTDLSRESPAPSLLEDPGYLVVDPIAGDLCDLGPRPVRTTPPGSP